jgi:hypothetical protein
MMKGMPRLILRALVAVSIIVAALVVGAQLRASREQLATGQAGSAASVQPTTTVPTPIATVQVTAPQQQATPAPAARTVVPTPVTTPYTGPTMLLSGRVTMGGAPVRGAQVMVYPSDPSNHGPTPVPPESARAITDARGAYQVQLPPGTYRVGAFRDYSNPIKDFGDGYTWVTWYGDGFVIGLGRDLVVSSGAVVADIALLRSVTISGRVVGKDGVGVPGAQLSLSRYVGGIQFPFGGAISDAGGRFTLPHVAMQVQLSVSATGRSGPAFTTMDLDLQNDVAGLLLTLDRGNIVSGTLRDVAGKPLADTNFGVTPTDTQIVCGWCNGRSDSAGHFSITLPTATVRFRNWQQYPTDPDLLSLEYAISGDMTLDPVLKSR